MTVKYLKSIGQLWLNSLSSWQFYQQLHRVQLKKSIAMYLIFLTLVAVLNTFWFWKITAPQLKSQIEASINELAKAYPADLVVEWNGAQLTTNFSPVVFEMPISAPPFFSDLADNLLILNTNQAEVDESALLTITTSSVVLFANGTSGQPTDLEFFLGDSFVVSSTNVPALQDQAEAMYRRFASFVSLLFFPGYLIGVFLIRLVGLLFDSVLIYFIFCLNRYQTTFLSILQLCLHLYVPAEIIQQIALRVLPEMTFSMHSFSFWILFLFLFFSNKLGMTRRQYGSR